MPAKPMWFLRLPQILEELNRLESPVLDRALVERLFGVRRRQAITLMHQFSGYQTGKAFLLDRLQLIRTLAQLRDHDDFHRERARKQRLVDSLNELRQFRSSVRVAIPAPVASNASLNAALPPGVDLGPGLLAVRFTTPEELLGTLFLLAQNIAADFEHFRQISSAG
jgi:hypothetical protein